MLTPLRRSFVARGPPLKQQRTTCEMDHGVEMNKTDDDCGGSLLTLVLLGTTTNESHLPNDDNVILNKTSFFS